jgi:hypothetical protein
MTKIHLLAGTMLLALAPLATAQQAAAPAKKLYCWSENGRKVCGDALPSTAVDSARTEISARSGLATGRIDRSLSPEERAAAAAKSEAEQQAALAEAARLRRELAMVDSYATEGDLRRAYEHRISLSEGTVEASRMGIDGLRQSLLTLLKRAGEAELAGKPVAPPLAANIHAQHDLLVRQQAMLVQQQHEAGLFEGEFANALARYRALKSPAKAAVAGPASDG